MVDGTEDQAEPAKPRTFMAVHAQSTSGDLRTEMNAERDRRAADRRAAEVAQLPTDADAYRLRQAEQLIREAGMEHLMEPDTDD
jgi:hypothetical protein